MNGPQSPDDSNRPNMTPYELGLADDPDVTWETYTAFTKPKVKAADERWVEMAQNQAEDVLLGRWPYSEASAPAQRIVDRYFAWREAAARESRGNTLSASAPQPHAGPATGTEHDADLRAGHYAGRLSTYLPAAEPEPEVEP